jgi:hypothetical protein
MMAVQQSDGSWRWVINGPDGQKLAESPDTFDNAAACGYALHAVRTALAADIRQASKRASGNSHPQSPFQARRRNIVMIEEM